MIFEDDLLIPDLRYIPILLECINNLEKWGYHYDYKSIHWDIKKMDPLGLTRWEFNADKSVNNVSIIFNQGLITQSQSVIYDTVYHELAHVIAGPNAEHGAEWKKIVSDIRNRTGLKMQVMANKNDIDELYRIVGYDHSYMCTKCGEIIGINNNDHYFVDSQLIHTGCGGILKRIK